MAIVTVDPSKYPESSTSGIQEAVNALPASGGMIIIPAGRYLLRAPIIARANLTMRGEGDGTVLERPAPIYALLAQDTEANKTSVVLISSAGLKTGDAIWIRDYHQIGYNARVLVIQAIEGNRVDGVIVQGKAERTYTIKEEGWAVNFFPGFLAERMDGVTVESLVFDGGSFEYDQDFNRQGMFTCAAVHTRSVRNLRLSNVTVRRWPGDGLSVQDGSAIVTGCIVEECLGIGLHPGTNIACSVWTGNISRFNRHGLLFCHGVRNAVVTNNVIMGNREHGIYGLMDPDRYNVIVGNVCAENGHYGIEAWKGIGNCIVGNLCRSNSRALPGNYAGIHVEKHSDNLVAGNLCLDDQERPTQLRGIDSVDAAGCNLVEMNHAPQYSGYVRAGEESERRLAAHKERTGEGDKEAKHGIH